MALTFPLALADLAEQLHLASVAWNLLRFEETSILGSGEFLTAELAPPVWEADCASNEMYDADAYALLARLNALGGSLNTFLLHNTAKPAPRMDPNGTILGAANPVIATIAANRKELTISGLPANYVLSGGDFMQITYGSGRVAFLQIVVGKTASGAGLTGLIEVTPHMRPGITEGLVVKLFKPAAKMKLVPGSLRIESAGTTMSRLRFLARQTLAAT